MSEHLRAQWRKAAGSRYIHASPSVIAPGEVLTVGDHRNFRGGGDDGVYMTTEETEAEQWGNAIADENTGVQRIYLYEVEPQGEVEKRSTSLANRDGFWETMIEHVAESAIVKRLLYSYDVVTGEATYP